MKKKNSTRKIDMAEHDIRLKSLGIQERAAKKMLRIMILLIPAALVAIWIISNWK